MAEASLTDATGVWYYDTTTPAVLKRFVQVGTVTEVTIPTNLDGSTALTTINASCFDDAEGHKITKVLGMPNTVTTIKYAAFNMCASLTSIVLSTGLTTVESYIFADTGIATFTIPASLTNLTVECFASMRYLTSITIPNTVTTMGPFSFYYCNRLASVTIGTGVTTVGSSAFKFNYALTSITIPNTVTSIGTSCFEGCTLLASATIGTGITAIPTSCFKTTGLTSLVIPNTVNSIGVTSISACDSLLSVTIGGGVTTIGAAAFDHSSALANITFIGNTAPISVGAGWIDNTPAGIHGHTQPASNFPAPGQTWNGLLMANYIVGNTWIAASAANWNTDANWSLGHKPTAGEDVVFDSAVSANNCAMNEAFTVNSITLTGAGGGVVTQGAVDIGYGNYTQGGWTWTGVATNTQTCTGDFAHTAGAISDSLLKLNMSGTSKNFATVGGYNLKQFTIDGSITATAGVQSLGYVISSGKSLTISSGRVARLWNISSSVFTNNGIIQGAGTFDDYFASATSMDITFGNITCSVTIRLKSDQASDVCTLLANTALGSTLTVISDHATNTMTLATSTYTLQCGALTLDTRGCLSQTGAGGNVTCTSYTQSGAGSVLTGKVDATFTVSGAITKTAGTFTNSVTNLILSGVSSVIASNSELVLYSLRVSGTPLVSSAVSTNGGSIIIDSGAKLTFTGTGYIYFRYVTGTSFTNNGEISRTGSGQLYLTLSNANQSIRFGTLTLPVEILTAGQNADRTLTLTSSSTISTVTIDSGHATFTISFDLNGKSLTASGLITASTRGIITSSVPVARITALGGLTVAAGGTIDWTNMSLGSLNGNYDGSAGTVTGNPTIMLFGGPVGQTIKLAAGQSLTNVLVKAGAGRLKLLSDTTITGVIAHFNPVDTNGFALIYDVGKEYTTMRRPNVRTLRKIDIGAVTYVDAWLQNLGGVI